MKLSRKALIKSNRPLVQSYIPVLIILLLAEELEHKIVK